MQNTAPSTLTPFAGTEAQRARDLFNALAIVRLAAQAKPIRIRQLDVRDDHIPELLAGITDLILARRRAGMPVGIAAEEMQAALTAMLQS